MKRERTEKERARKCRDKDTDVLEISVKAPSSSALIDEMDALLDEIDELLEENAEEFVANYVQKGGE